MIWALVFMASASFCSAQKADGAVTLVSESDSLSYAAGACSTEGLIPYVQQSYSVDTAYMADFVRGYLEGIKVANDPYFPSGIYRHVVERPRYLYPAGCHAIPG